MIAFISRALPRMLARFTVFSRMSSFRRPIWKEKEMSSIYFYFARIIISISRSLTLFVTVNGNLLLQHSPVQTPRSHDASVVFHSRYRDRVRIIIRSVHRSSGFIAGRAAQRDGRVKVASILGGTGFIQQRVRLFT